LKTKTRKTTLAMLWARCFATLHGLFLPAGSFISVRLADDSLAYETPVEVHPGGRMESVKMTMRGSVRFSAGCP